MASQTSRVSEGAASSFTIWEAISLVASSIFSSKFRRGVSRSGMATESRVHFLAMGMVCATESGTAYVTASGTVYVTVSGKAYVTASGTVYVTE